ncbi:protein RRP5 homolog isoform 2-T2 [Synchiropus picturatus]
MDFVEEDFPRGGTDKPATASKIVVPRAEVDNLFQPKDEPKTKKRKGASKDEEAKVKKKKVDKEKGSLALNAEEKKIHILHAKDLKEGMLMLGCVKEVADFEVTVGLPCGLQGILNIKNICDSFTKTLTEQLDSDDTEDICSLSQLFTPGMLLRCVIAKMDVASNGFITVQLSINPKLVNAALTSSSLKAGMVLSGCVESIEDHGFIIDIGVSGTKAFAPRKKVTTPEELKVGQYVVSQVKQVKNDGRVAQLSIGPLTPDQAAANTQQEWSLSNLLPGLLVKATIKKAAKHGLILEFLSSFSGQVDFLHMEQDQISHYSVGAEVQARLLYIEPSTRLIGMSLRRYLVGLEPSIEAWSGAGDCVGEVAKGCSMTSMHHMSGALLELPDKRVAFVHRNHLKEPSERENVNKLLALEDHTCRIMSFSPMERIHFASLRKSVIEQTFFRYQDVQVGQIIEGTVTTLLPHGMMVQISSRIKGLVPRTHLSDILLKKPEKKYMPGMAVKCRVLSVDHEKKRLYLTRKKSLIESTLPRFLSYSDARKGLVSHGFIVSIKDFGCIVRFYNDVKGLVPTEELSSEPSINPADVFYVGQVMKTKVLQCNEKKARLHLSFKAALEGAADEPAPTQLECDVGSMLEAKVLRKTLNGLEVAILPEEVQAFLPTTHLSDHVSNCLLLWENLQEGDVVSNLTCVFNNQKRINLSKKPSVVRSLEEGQAAKDFSEIKIGMQLVGWIKNIMTYGVFIEFPNGLCGLAPTSAMSDKFLKETANTFQIGQTVMAKVTNLDEEKKRFLLSLRISDIIVSPTDAHTRLINGLKERRAAAEMLSTRDSSGLVQKLAALTVGQRLKLSVDSVTEDGGATFKSDDLAGANIVANKFHVGGNISVGQQVAAVVLYADVFSACVHVSMLPKLNAKKTTLDVDTSYTAIVQHVVGDFAVVSLGNTAQFTMIQTRNCLNQIFMTDGMKGGMILAAEVVEVSCEELQGLPLVSWKYTDRKQRTESQSEDKGLHRFGDILQGKVRTVKPTRVVVSLEDGSLANIHVSEMMEAESLTVKSFPTSTVVVGSLVTARVIGGREAVSHRFLPFSHPRFSYKVPELTIVPSKLNPKVPLSQNNAKDLFSSYAVGDEITCFVSKFIPKPKILEVTIGLSLTGTVELLAMITDPKNYSHPDKLYKPGQVVRAKIVANGVKPQLSLIDYHELKKDTVTLGIVTSIHPHTGVHVKLPFGGSGTASITDLADAYKSKLLESFKKEQLVRCYLLSQENGKWRLSLRPSRVVPETAKAAKDPEVKSLEDISVGQVVRGYIKSVGDKGVFVMLSGTITGRAQFQMTSKYYIKDPKVLAKHLPLNALLTTKIISVDREQKLVDLSLLSEDTGKPDVLPESLGLSLRLVGEEKLKHDAIIKKKRGISATEEQVPKKKKKTKNEDSDSGVEVYFREEEDGGDKKPAKPAAKEKAASSAAPSRLQVAAGFCWDVGLTSLKPASDVKDEDSSDEEDQEDSSKPQKKTRHELEKEKKAAEKALVQRETELMDPNLRPQDAAAFERLLLASPNSSLLWLQYMAHHLQATQIEQARAVAERALKTISFREEQEKLNVWVALMNLENMYGTEESLKKVFDRALQFCEPMPVYQQLADIYAKSDKVKEAEATYKSMVKRFRQDKAAWLNYGTFLLQRGESDAAAGLLQRALKSLPTKQSVDVIAKFAQLEFRYGDAERGRAMFDKVMTSYPKRTDLWSVFIDLMIKHGSQKDIRALFDRVIHLSVSVKKIKFFFKRYLEYEKKHGTPQSVQAVKEKAVAFVEAKGTEAAN